MPNPLSRTGVTVAPILQPTRAMAFDVPSTSAGTVSDIDANIDDVATVVKKPQIHAPAATINRLFAKQIIRSPTDADRAVAGSKSLRRREISFPKARSPKNPHRIERLNTLDPFTDEPKPPSTMKLEIRSAFAVANETKRNPIRAFFKVNFHSFLVMGRESAGLF